MPTSYLEVIAGRIMNHEQHHDICVLLRDGKVEVAKEVLRLRIDDLYLRGGDMTREIGLELYNELMLPPETASLFPQK